MPSGNKVIVTAEPGRQELFITREFDAPRELVYRAHIDPKLFVQWIGPHRLSTTLETFEPVSGGNWRFTQKDADGSEYKFHGVFHEVSAELLIQTFEYDGMPERGHVVLDTMRLEEMPGSRTRLTIQSVYQSVEDRDGMVKSGMEMGVREGYERLDDILAEMK